MLCYWDQCVCSDMYVRDLGNEKGIKVFLEGDFGELIIMMLV